MGFWHWEASSKELQVPEHESRKTSSLRMQHWLICTMRSPFFFPRNWNQPCQLHDILLSTDDLIAYPSQCLLNRCKEWKHSDRIAELSNYSWGVRVTWRWCVLSIYLYMTSKCKWNYESDFMSLLGAQ